MRKKLRRLLRLAPIAALFAAGMAHAQTTGTIVGVVTDATTGKPVAGALVIATSSALQGEQTDLTNNQGQYTLTTLPPGRYKLSVQLQGYKPAERSDIVLRVDFTLRANVAIIPEAVQLEEQLVKTGVAPAVNIGSAEAGTIVSKEFLATVPTARTYENVATIAPTATRDMYGVSFAGASSPENNYIIDGLRVSDPSYGTLGTNLLTNFVDQLDVKVGSFMPEYGFSSAGIINTVTKSGGNEFHGSIWGNITPGIFTPMGQTLGNNGQAVASYSTPYKGSYNADFGLEVGGPIVKDKLWFYAGFAPQMTYSARTKFYRTRVPCPTGTPASQCSGGYLIDATGQYVMNSVDGTESTYGAGYNRYFALAKLTWLINENHNVVGSFNTQPTNQFGLLGVNGAASVYTDPRSYNNTNAVLNYTGKFVDKHLLLNVTGGWYNSTQTTSNKTVDGVDILNTPLVQWRTTQNLSNFVSGFTCPVTGGCVVQNYNTGGYGYTEDPKNNRYSANASLTGLFNLAGQHQLKGGAQIEYSTYDTTKYYSGGAAIRAFGRPGAFTGGSSSNSFQIYRAYGVMDPTSPDALSGYKTNACAAYVNGVCVNQGLHDPTNPGTSAANTFTWSNGYYLQDSWTIANVLTLNFGVRLDTQKIQNNSQSVKDDLAANGWSDSLSSLSISNMWAPRVQAIWDFTGNGRGKIQGNWGMYYQAIPLDIAVRAFGSESQVGARYQASTCLQNDPKVNPGLNPMGLVNGVANCPNVYGLTIGQGPGPNTANLSGLGFYPTSAGYYSPISPDLKGAYTQQFGGGIDYELIQDLSVGVNYIGRRIGDVIEDMSSNDGVSYYIANPTVSAAWTQATGPYQGSTFNASNAAAVDPMTGTVVSPVWAKPERSYDAITFTVNKLFSKKWLAQASYTWSSLRGNYPGLNRWENAQLDPNITSEYDLPTLLGNKTGPLPGNRSNQVKLAGSYFATLSPTVNLIPSVNFQALSGLPVNSTAGHPLYGNTDSFLLPFGSAGNLPWTFQLDLGAKVSWAFAGAYTLQFSLDVFNILNMQTTQWVDPIYTYSFAQPIQNAYCSNHTSMSAKNPITALNEACPDLPYTKTLDGLRIVPNLNYGRPQNSAGGIGAYQAPISARFGVALSF